MGMVRIKALARMHVWWPKIDENIESHANQCISCQENLQEPTRALVLTCESDDPVWIRNYTGKPKWIAGKVTGPVSYKVKMTGQTQRRHIDQLKKRLVDVDLTSRPADTNDNFLLFLSP